MASDKLSSPILMKETIAQGATRYSQKCSFRECAGPSAAVIIITTAGKITVTQQCSPGEEMWHDAIDVAGAPLGITTDLTVTAGVYISFTPIMCEFLRFKVVEGNVAPTAVTIQLIFRPEV